MRVRPKVLCVSSLGTTTNIADIALAVEQVRLEDGGCRELVSRVEPLPDSSLIGRPPLKRNPEMRHDGKS